MARCCLVVPDGAFLIRSSISLFRARDGSFLLDGHLSVLTVKLLSNESVNNIAAFHSSYLNKKLTSFESAYKRTRMHSASYACAVGGSVICSRHHVHVPAICVSQSCMRTLFSPPQGVAHRPLSALLTDTLR